MWIFIATPPPDPLGFSPPTGSSSQFGVPPACRPRSYPQLFDLQGDPSETTDLARQRPDRWGGSLIARSIGR